MKTGRELDALIAEKVMGFKNIRYQQQGYHNDLVYGSNGMAGVADLVPFYSTDIAAAWKVVDHLEDEFEFMLIGPHRNLTEYEYQDNAWGCELTNETTRAWYYCRSDESAAEAICLAALKALGVEI